MKILMKLLALNLLFLSHSFAVQTSESEFFLIDELGHSANVQTGNLNFNSPQQLMGQTWTQGVAEASLNLLKWTIFKNQKVQVYEDYDRLKHFGTWVNDPNDNTCYNTRARVLVRDSKTPVTFKGPRNCSVDRGTWNDPYTKKTYTASSDIQIDHVVPLKNTYTTGAWKWNFYTRCLYANYTGNAVHLMSVQGSANMSKGDKSPERWLPPNESYRCEYVRNWLIIKLIWKLELTPNESLGIRNTLMAYRCPLNSYAITQRDFQAQRRLILASAQQCGHLKPR